MSIYLVTTAFILLLGCGLKPRIAIRNKIRFIFIAFTIIICIAALRKYTVGIDLEGHYYNSFIRMLSWEWKDAYGSVYEVGYALLNIAIGRLTSNPQVFIAINAIFVYGIYAWFIYRNSEDVFLSTVLVITLNEWFMYMNIMRQAFAIGIILIGLEMLKKESMGKIRYFLYIATVFVASSFHNSAVMMLIMLPVYFFKFKRVHLLASSILMISASLLYQRFFSFMSMLMKSQDYSEKYNYYGSAGLLNIYYILFFGSIFLIAYMFIISRRNRESLQKYNENTKNSFSDSFLMYNLLLLLICKILGTRLSVMARAGYYFYPLVWILLPRVLRNIDGGKNRILIRATFYTVALIMFVYVGYSRASKLYGTVPYQFFWQ